MRRAGSPTRSCRSRHDGIAIVTNPALEVECLTTDELKEIWESGSKVASLSEVDPSLPDAELSLYGPGTDSGTFEYFTETINGEEGNSRKDYQPSEDDNVLVQGVEGDEGGLGLLRLLLRRAERGQAEHRRESTAARAVSSRRPRRSSPASTHRSRGRCSCTRATRRSQKPEVKAFMDFVLENADSIAETALIVPADQATIDKSKTTLGG